MIEKLLALIIAIVCLVVSIYIWQLVAGHQPMWPLPALYLIEIPTLCIALAAARRSGDARSYEPHLGRFRRSIGILITGFIFRGFCTTPQSLYYCSCWRSYPPGERARAPWFPSSGPLRRRWCKVGIIYIGVVLS